MSAQAFHDAGHTIAHNTVGGGTLEDAESAHILREENSASRLLHHASSESTGMRALLVPVYFTFHHRTRPDSRRRVRAAARQNLVHVASRPDLLLLLLLPSRRITACCGRKDSGMLHVDTRRPRYTLATTALAPATIKQLCDEHPARPLVGVGSTRLEKSASVHRDMFLSDPENFCLCRVLISTEH